MKSTHDKSNQDRIKMITLASAYSSQIYQRFSTATEDSSETTSVENQPSNDTKGHQQDMVSLSGRGKELSAENPTDTKKTEGFTPGNHQGTGVQKDQTQTAHDLEILQQLKKRDADVRAHEQAHLSVAGQYAAGGASFSYQTGPDGTQYAIGGEVPINMSAEKTPEATIQKMETIKRAALAPADPSSADRQIAAEASAQEIQAMQELQTLQREKVNSHIASADPGTTAGGEKTGNRNTRPPSSPGTSPAASSQVSADNGRQMMVKAYQGVASLA
jgi:hypothetical protein